MDTNAQRVIAVGDVALDLVEKLRDQLAILGEAMDPDHELHSANLQTYNAETKNCLKVVETRLHTTIDTYRRRHAA